MRLSLIAAVASDGGIGRGNELLFKLREDMQHFKRMTLGHPIIMGRKTWDSIGRPLPGRRNIVMTRQRDWHADGAERAGSFCDAMAMVADVDQAFVIGGAELYALALPIANELVLTEVDAVVDGADAFFPVLDRNSFVETARVAGTGEGSLAYEFVNYRRR